MSLPFSYTPDASNQHVPACLSSGSIQLRIIGDNGCYSCAVNFPFIESALQHSSCVVKSLFKRNPLLSVEDMLKRFQKYHLDENPLLSAYKWRLFVNTININANGKNTNTFAQIPDNMLFLNIPEYLLNSDCLIICANSNNWTLNSMGEVWPGLVTRQYLANSANITADSEVIGSRKQVAESTRMLNFAHHFPEYTRDQRRNAIAMCKETLAIESRLCEHNTSEALKHKRSEALKHGQRPPDFV